MNKSVDNKNETLYAMTSRVSMENQPGQAQETRFARLFQTRANSRILTVLTFVGLFVQVSLFAQNISPTPVQHPLMHITQEEKQLLQTAHLLLPKSTESGSVTQQSFARSINLLPYLPYVPKERNQGVCGNCWAWAGTGVLEIANEVQNGFHDRLSVQFINSCDQALNCCDGGWLKDLADFYANQKLAIPWSNPNAQWVSGNGLCGPSPSSIGRMPCYPVTKIITQTIPTYRVGRIAAIANIMQVINEHRAVYFSFCMATAMDWRQFDNFWNNQPETAIWNDFHCGQVWGPDGGGHAVLCVGYNTDDPANPYWIMVNSWGTTPGRPNGLFRVSMNLDYDCADANSNYNLFWQTLDIKFTDLVPEPLSPANDSAGVHRPTALSWRQVPGATSYQVQISYQPSNGGDRQLVENMTTSQASYTSQALAAGRNYYWRVAARIGSTTKGWSQESHFSTR